MFTRGQLQSNNNFSLISIENKTRYLITVDEKNKSVQYLMMDTLACLQRVNNSINSHAPKPWVVAASDELCGGSQEGHREGEEGEM